MTKCVICKSEMPDELFLGELCPICVMTERNKIHKQPFGTLPEGEIARELINKAWEYYKPTKDKERK